MRADRLVSLVLLLRQRGRLTADTLARELEVSTRTVLRDIEALSAAGVPVYAERGRHGGFALLPGFRTELTGLNHDEALALLTAGAGRGEQVFGLASALASARRKVVDALPESHRVTASDAAQRFLVEPGADLLSRRLVTEEVPDTTMGEVRRAVLAGHKLRIHYAATGQGPRWRTVDPIGLVTVRDWGYLLATRSDADRTYRLSRVLAAEELDEPAQRPTRVDLERDWQQRRAQFLSDDHLTVRVRVNPTRREDLLSIAVAVRAEEPDADGWLRLEVTFQDSRHAEWALWQLGTAPKPSPRSRCAPPYATAPPSSPPATNGTSRSRWVPPTALSHSDPHPEAGMGYGPRQHLGAGRSAALRGVVPAGVTWRTSAGHGGEGRTDVALCPDRGVSSFRQGGWGPRRAAPRCWSHSPSTDPTGPPPTEAEGHHDQHDQVRRFLGGGSNGEATHPHRLVHEVAPDLRARTWYGMPAYATPGKSGKVVCFFQSAGTVCTRDNVIGRRNRDASVSR